MSSLTPSSQQDRLLDLLAEWHEQLEQGNQLSPEELCPDDFVLQGLLHERIDQHLAFINCIDAGGKQHSRGSGVERTDVADEPLPTQIDRYRVERLLGAGGFGKIYLARDEQLDRHVAIKVPHLRRPKPAKPYADPQVITRDASFDGYLAEARAVAALDHPNIISVYDIGSTADIPCYVVTQYVDGVNLAELIQERRLSPVQLARLVADVASALHHAHLHGIVHRDVKPQNILIGKRGQVEDHVYLVDFGIALSRDSTTSSNRYLGTPGYMSPEQARGESHRIDGRSDIFSLGVVFYELLTGRRPFQSDHALTLLKQIATADPVPPRQVSDAIPRELERICQKALGKRASDRYTVAADMAEDLRRFIDEVNHSSAPSPEGQSTSSHYQEDTSGAAVANTGASPRLSTTPPTVVDALVIPKGLRAFDVGDAEFYLRLLPGPKDRDGLPDSLRFWLRRLSSDDAQTPMQVGLLYGPSGSGKSSFVQAALLPRLDRSTTPLYVIATPVGTSTSLMDRLRELVGPEAMKGSLPETLLSLRTHPEQLPTQKLLIVIDQFEQWLHGHSDFATTDLLNGLRQCDGKHLQCLLLIRDDFWLQVTRFFRELEIPLLQGDNSSLIDLFDVKHAEYVLGEFGRAYGRLPHQDDGQASQNLTVADKQFLQQAVAGLEEAGRVICVRLAVFAEMLRWKPWTAATLKAYGGHAGLGIAFLDQAFCQRTSQPSHRAHDKAAQRVLQSFLPATTEEMLSCQRTYLELLEASGYQAQPALLDELIAILDRDLKLITPGRRDQGDHQPVYQLSHDYLVPSIRGWLLQKQQETRRGRARLQLQDRARFWKATHERRQLPSLIEWCYWSCMATGPWQLEEKKMMQAATRLYGGIGLTFLSIACMLVALFFGLRRAELSSRVRLTLESIQNCRAESVAELLRDLRNLPAEEITRELELIKPSNRSDQQLRLGYVASTLGDCDLDLFVNQIPDLPVNEIDNLVMVLTAHRSLAIPALHRAMTKAAESSSMESQARVAVIALHLGDVLLAQEMAQCMNRPDQTPRTVFIETLIKFHGSLINLHREMSLVNDASLRSAVALALACVNIDDITETDKNIWEPLLSDWFVNAPEAITHSAAGMPFSYWSMPIPALRQSETKPGQQWQVNSQLMTLVRIEHKDAPFLISDREVTQAQFVAFCADPLTPMRDKAQRKLENAVAAFDPITNIRWRDAVLYCNWLSRKEGRVPYYARKDEAAEDNYDNWQTVPNANGYRLPTFEQWIVAARAGTSTSWYWGKREYTTRYANLGSPYVAAVGLHLPNGNGLFDLIGNASELCTHTQLGCVLMGMDSRTTPEVAQVDSLVFTNPDRTTPYAGFRVALPAD